MNVDLEAWFCQEILPYERALVRFLVRKGVSPADVDDIRHEVYVRVIEATERQRPISPKSFMFAIARNVLVDRIRRDRIVSFEVFDNMDDHGLLVDEISPERVLTGAQQISRLLDAFEKLPNRCRDVVWMKRIESMPQREIALKLGISESTVEKHLIRGIGLLASALYEAGAGSACPLSSRAKNRAGLESNESANRSRTHRGDMDFKARQWKLDGSGC